MVKQVKAVQDRAYVGWRFIRRTKYLLASVLTACAFASAGVASDRLELETQSICRTPTIDSASIWKQLENAGWKVATTRADRRRVAENVVLGNFYSQQSDWKSSWKEQSRTFAKFKNAQETVRDSGVHMFRLDLYVASAEGQKYLILQEDRVTSTSGKLKLLSRECNLVTPPSAATDALKALGTLKRGYLKLPEKALRADGRNFRISGRYISMDVDKLPIKTKATEFTRIRVYSDQ